MSRRNFVGSLANVIVALSACGLTGCGPNTAFLRPGPRPPELAGNWIDLSHTSNSDTAVWNLTPSGADRLTHVIVRGDPDGTIRLSRTETAYGSWYMEGALSDASGRRLCFKPRARNGGSCTPFRLDTLQESGSPSRRRLIISDYVGGHRRADRVLLERVP